MSQTSNNQSELPPLQEQPEEQSERPTAQSTIEIAEQQSREITTPPENENTRPQPREITTQPANERAGDHSREIPALSSNEHSAHQSRQITALPENEQARPTATTSKSTKSGTLTRMWSHLTSSDKKKSSTNLAASTSNLLQLFKKTKTDEEIENLVIKSLSSFYQNYILPVEKHFKMEKFLSSPWDESELTSKPMVVLVGQYSTGKTTFIQHLIGETFDGAITGEVPTTDRFIAVMHGLQKSVIKGEIAVHAESLPFRQLSNEPEEFFKRFQVSTVNNKVLQHLTFVDTPGVLATNDENSRGYNYINVMKWFIERAQLVVVFFDPQKLDFSTEFKQVLAICNENKSKLMFALNKIDSVDNADMIRVYGSIMYLLGKCVNIPEPPNVRLVSFQSNPLNRNSNMHSFFKQNEREMLDIIQNLPKSHNRDRLGRVIERAHKVRVYGLVIGYLSNKYNSKPLYRTRAEQDKKMKINSEIEKYFKTIVTSYKIDWNDMPNLMQFQRMIQNFDLSQIESAKLTSKWIGRMDELTREKTNNLIREQYKLDVIEELERDLFEHAQHRDVNEN